MYDAVTQTSTKAAPKSCGCQNCRRARHGAASHVLHRLDEARVRGEWREQERRIVTGADCDPVVPIAPHGERTG